MMHKELIIVIASIFTIVEALIIFNFFRQKKYNYFFENTIIYIAMTLFLYFEYNSKFQTNIYIILSVLGATTAGIISTLIFH